MKSVLFCNLPRYSFTIWDMDRKRVRKMSSTPHGIIQFITVNARYKRVTNNYVQYKYEAETMTEPRRVRVERFSFIFPYSNITIMIYSITKILRIIYTSAFWRSMFVINGKECEILVQLVALRHIIRHFRAAAFPPFIWFYFGNLQITTRICHIGRDRINSIRLDFEKANRERDAGANKFVLGY